MVHINSDTKIGETKMKITYFNDTNKVVNFHIGTTAKGDLSPLAPQQMRELVIPNCSEPFIKTWEREDCLTLLIMTRTLIKPERTLIVKEEDKDCKNSYHYVLPSLTDDEIVFCFEELISSDKEYGFIKILRGGNVEMLIINNTNDGYSDMNILIQQITYEMAKRFSENIRKDVYHVWKIDWIEEHNGNKSAISLHETLESAETFLKMMEVRNDVAMVPFNPLIKPYISEVSKEAYGQMLSGKKWFFKEDQTEYKLKYGPEL